VREALLAKLEVDAQQAVIDRRARETYINSAPSMLLTLLADAGTIADLLTGPSYWVRWLRPPTSSWPGL